MGVQAVSPVDIPAPEVCRADRWGPVARQVVKWAPAVNRRPGARWQAIVPPRGIASNGNGPSIVRGTGSARVAVASPWPIAGKSGGVAMRCAARTRERAERHAALIASAMPPSIASAAPGRFDVWGAGCVKRSAVRRRSAAPRGAVVTARVSPSSARGRAPVGSIVIPGPCPIAPRMPIVRPISAATSALRHRAMGVTTVSRNAFPMNARRPWNHGATSCDPNALAASCPWCGMGAGIV